MFIGIFILDFTLGYGKYSSDMTSVASGPSKKEATEKAITIGWYTSFSIMSAIRSSTISML